jgi:hypothetical protein
MPARHHPITLGYHGCRREVGERVISGADRHLKVSANPWDWLGEGAYFWESDPQRGYEWAKERYGPENCCVIGAVINPGNCLDLMSRRAMEVLRGAYDSFIAFHNATSPEAPLPENKNTSKGPSHNLDCAVINHLDRIRRDYMDNNGVPAPLPSFDTVRGLFQEGDGVFPGSRILSKTHVQVCVKNPAKSVQGYFRVDMSGYSADRSTAPIT